MAKNFIENQELKKQIIESLSDCDTFLIVACKNHEHKIYIESEKENMGILSDIAGAMLASIDSLEEKARSQSFGLGLILIVVFSQAIRNWNKKIRDLTGSIITIQK
jgi:hypothetical protein